MPSGLATLELGGLILGALGMKRGRKDLDGNQADKKETATTVIVVVGALHTHTHPRNS